METLGNQEQIVGEISLKNNSKDGLTIKADGITVNLGSRPRWENSYLLATIILPDPVLAEDKIGERARIEKLSGQKKLSLQKRAFILKEVPNKDVFRLQGLGKKTDLKIKVKIKKKRLDSGSLPKTVSRQLDFYRGVEPFLGEGN